MIWIGVGIVGIVVAFRFGWNCGWDDGFKSGENIGYQKGWHVGAGIYAPPSKAGG